MGMPNVNLRNTDKTEVLFTQFELRIEFCSNIIIFEMQKQFKNGNFVSKLDKILSNPEFEQIITWDHSRKYIDVLNSEKMKTQITPIFFRHSKFESFVRQLNLYGFRKIKNHGRLRFSHPLLLDGLPLSSISTSKSAKNEKGTKRSSSEESSSVRDVQEFVQEQIPQNSITVASGSEADSRRDDNFKGVYGLGSSRWEAELARSNCMMMGGQYMAWYNMMSMMSMGGCFPSMMPAGTLQSSGSQ